MWLPEDVVFVDSLPLGATGKVQKTRLREIYRNHGRAAEDGRSRRRCPAMPPMPEEKAHD